MTTTTDAGPTGRLDHLLRAVREQGGEWTTKRVLALYRRLGLEPDGMRYTHLRSVARGDLRDLARMGHLVQGADPNSLSYTLNTRKDDAQ